MPGPTQDFMKPFLALLLSTILLAQAPTCPPQSYTQSLVCLYPVVTQNSMYWAGPNPVYITNETQVVSGAPRANFNLANCHDPSCYFFNVMVYHNGARLAPDVDYGRSGYTVVLTIPAAVGDRVVMDYSYFWVPVVATPTGTNQ